MIRMSRLQRHPRHRHRSYRFHYGRLTRLNFLGHLFLIRRIHLENFLPIRHHQTHLVFLDYYSEALGLHPDRHLLKLSKFQIVNYLRYLYF